MDLNEISNKWQKNKMPLNLDNDLIVKIITFDDELKKENTKAAYWLAGTIYFTGIVVIPFLNSEKQMFILIGLWFLIGLQAILFIIRQTNMNKSMIDNPMKFIDAKLAKLKYHLVVTNIFMPAYTVILGTLSSLYLYEVLKGVSYNILILSILSLWTFYVIIFFVIWNKQRKYNSKRVIPQIIELKNIKAGYHRVE